MKLFKFILTITIGSIILIGCNKDNIDDRGTSEFTVRMHDTTGPFAHVWIDVQAAYIHYADSAEEDWEEVEVNEGLYDLLELQDGNDTILVPLDEIWAGHVTQFRLLLGSGNYATLLDSTDVVLDVPSGQQSGIKIPMNYIFKDNQAYEIEFDFDVDQSIHQTEGETYKLDPVIRVEGIEEL